MRQAVFHVAGTMVVVSRLGPAMVGLTVHAAQEDGAGLLLALAAPLDECEVGAGDAPWPASQATLRVGQAVLPLAGEVEVGEAEAVLLPGALQ